MKDRGLEDLLAWQKAKELAVLICKEVLQRLPADERFVLARQLRRSVQSVSANIAEAYGRFHYQDAIRFCYVARGSLLETYSHLILARDLGYIGGREMTTYIDLLNGYIDYLRRSKQGGRDVKAPEDDAMLGRNPVLDEPDP
ncbi:MAG: four helix bundle protein [Anaerolineales bacterium]|nr:four helix bundle protein [Anaerolineales bacterium]